MLKINDGYWGSVQRGDNVCFIDEKHESTDLTVDSKAYFGNFGEAWFVLGSKLMLKDNTICTVSGAKRYFSAFYSDDDVGKFGVVAMRFQNITV